MNKSMTQALQSMQPNDVVIEKVLSILPEEILKTIKSEKISKFDFAMSIIRLMVKTELCTMDQAWDIVFGKGTYSKFKDAIYTILKDQAGA